MATPAAIAGTSGKCPLRAACHSCGPYRVPNVDVESKAVYTNNPTSGAMRGFGTNQAQFAMEGIMDLLAERVGVDGWDIRERNILNPGDRSPRGQIMRESVRGVARDARRRQGHLQERQVHGIGCGIKSTGHRQRHHRRRARQFIPRARRPATLVEVLNGYTEMGQGIYTATMQVVCEETGLSPDIMTVTLGHGARREMRRDVGVARHHAELRRRAERPAGSWPPT